MILLNILPLCVVLMYILPIHRMTLRLVNEKESRLGTLMKIMGMSHTAYWLSWFIYHLCIVTIISVCATAILTRAVLPYSNFGLIFLILFLYGLSQFGYVVFMSAFFSSPKIASLACNLIYFFSSFCDYAVENQYLTETRKNWASLLPSIAMKRAFYNVVKFEEAKAGLQPENLEMLYYGYRV